jgi:hypothetical protein
MSTYKSSVNDEDLLPSAAGAQSGAGQPAIAPWLSGTGDEHRLTTHLSNDQQRWVVAVCEASRGQGMTLTPAAVVRAAVDRLMHEHNDATEAAEVLRPV